MLFPRLTRSQKEAVGLLQIGTFLEYFDLYLYVHMAVFLNEIFFPKSDPHTTSLLSAFAFCSTWLLRPIGALIFGWIGDHMGRKVTVVITTFMMAVSCLAMASLPTYAQVGMMAAWGITICRMVQGLSSLGEIMGAQVYLTEITRPPAQYTVVAFTAAAAGLGGTMALAVASLCTSKGWDWRYVFLFGASIAVVGSVARTRLRETPEFLAAHARKEDGSQSEYDAKTVRKSYLAYFLISCARPFFFYFVYVFMVDAIRTRFGMDAADVIYQNFFVAATGLLQVCVLIYLTLYIHPMRIMRWFSYFGFILMLTVPHLLDVARSPNDIFLIQIFTIVLAPDCTPSQGFLCSHMPVLSRFTSMSLLYALSRALMYSIVTFGMVLLTSKFGNVGLWIIGLPLCAGFAWGVYHFRQLAKIEQSQIGGNIPSNLVVTP